MMKLDTPVGDPIGLTLTTPRNVVDDVHVVLLSGCKDSQESADVSDTTEFGLPKSAGPGGAGGACTNALLTMRSGWPSSLLHLQFSFRFACPERRQDRSQHQDELRTATERFF